MDNSLHKVVGIVGDRVWVEGDGPQTHLELQLYVNGNGSLRALTPSQAESHMRLFGQPQPQPSSSTSPSTPGPQGQVGPTGPTGPASRPTPGANGPGPPGPQPDHEPLPSERALTGYQQTGAA